MSYYDQDRRLVATRGAASRDRKHEISECGFIA
jgi:hypothetical protein